MGLESWLCAIACSRGVVLARENCVCIFVWIEVSACEHGIVCAVLKKRGIFVRQRTHQPLELWIIF